VAQCESTHPKKFNYISILCDFITRATLIPWGDLFVDGKRQGRGSRIRTELPAGRHTLEMRQGERSVAKSVARIRPGPTTTVKMVGK